MKVDLYERIWMWLAAVLIAAFLGAIALAAGAQAIQPPSHVETIDPATVYEAPGFSSPGLVEEPELMTLYLVETAKGLGMDVVGVDVRNAKYGAQLVALALPSADVGGVLRFIDQNESRMAPETVAMFSSIDAIGTDQLHDDPTGGDDDVQRPN